MPIYEYVCSNCKKTTDTLQKLSDPPPEVCPACGAKGTLSRVVSRTSFVLKGGGWHADLYGSSKKPDTAAPAGGSEPPATKTDGAATPAAAPAAPAAAPASTSPTPAAAKPTKNSGDT